MRHARRHAAPNEIRRDERARGAGVCLRGLRAAVLVQALVFVIAGSAHADPPSVTVGALSAEHSLVLRPAPSLRPIALEVREILALRTPIVVVVGDDAPEGAPDLVAEGEVGIAITDARTTPEILAEGSREVHRVRVVLGAPDRVTYATELTTSEERPASARSIALAILALRDSALVGRDRDAQADPDAPAYTYRVPSDGPLGPQPSLTPSVRPAFSLRVLAGVSLVQSAALVSFGGGVGICVRYDCYLLEADLPLVYDDPNDPRAPADYRPSVLGLRAHLAPLTVGTVRFGLAIGPIVRVGNLGRRGMAEPVVTLGARATLLAAWEFVRRFDWMIELGVDAASTVSGGLTLEHVLTPWATIALRIRP